MAHIRPIRTDADHEAALARIDTLMDARSGTREGDELDVLATLVDRYEEQRFPIAAPTPVDAILFRMEQAGLTRRDLESMLGGRAKVSEVLGGKRPLTLQMIRALNARLGIPAEALLQEEQAAAARTDGEPEWDRFPVAEMARCGWFEHAVAGTSLPAEKLMRGLREQAGGPGVATCGLYRKNDHARVGTMADPYALTAWCWRALAMAHKEKVAGFAPKTVSLEFLTETVKLSRFSDGPKRARTFLGEHGIRLVIVRHLSRTHLDGAALQLEDGSPVVGLTLRYDRLDSFWFCLCHELAHVGRHFGSGVDQPFLDDVTAVGLPGEVLSPAEQEADEWAREALIPSKPWQASVVREHPSPTNVIAFADDLGVAPAIVAGRVRYERRNYRLLSHFVGSGEVRRQLGYQDC